MLSSGGEGENYEKDVDDPIVDEDHERMLQMMEEIRKAKYEKNTAEAIAKGYSSFEELVEERMERSRHLQKAHEKYMEEKAASLGITVDELIEQDPQRDRHTPYLAETPPIQCDCDDHFIPFFCPRSLVLRQSQDAPELAEHLNNQHRFNPDALSIKQGDKSRRLSQGSLETYWTQRNPLKYLGPWPIWYRNDRTLREIIVQSMPRLREDRSQSSVFTEDMSQGAKVATRSPISTPELGVQQPGLSSRKQEFTAEENAIVELPLTGSRRIRSPRKRRSKPQTRKPAVLRQSRSVHKSGTAPTTTRVQKSTLPPSKRTRSRNVGKFYEIGLNGSIIELGRSRKYG